MSLIFTLMNGTSQPGSCFCSMALWETLFLCSYFAAKLILIFKNLKLIRQVTIFLWSFKLLDIIMLPIKIKKKKEVIIHKNWNSTLENQLNFTKVVIKILIKFLVVNHGHPNQRDNILLTIKSILLSSLTSKFLTDGHLVILEF